MRAFNIEGRCGVESFTYNNSGGLIDLKVVSGSSLVGPPRCEWRPLCAASRSEAFARVHKLCRTDSERTFVQWLANECTVQSDTVLHYLDRMLSRLEQECGQACRELSALAERHGDASLDQAKEVSELTETSTQVRDRMEDALEDLRLLTEANEFLNKKLEQADAELSALRAERSRPSPTSSQQFVPGQVVYDKVSGRGPYVLIQTTSTVIETKPAKSGEKVSSPYEVVEDAWLVHTKSGDSVRLPRAILAAERPQGRVMRVLSSRVTASVLFALTTGCLLYNIILG